MKTEKERDNRSKVYAGEEICHNILTKRVMEVVFIEMVNYFDSVKHMLFYLIPI